MAANSVGIKTCTSGPNVSFSGLNHDRPNWDRNYDVVDEDDIRAEDDGNTNDGNLVDGMVNDNDNDIFVDAKLL